MKYDSGHRSDHVDDRRGRSGRGGPGGSALRIGGGVSVPIILLVVLFTVFSGGSAGDLGAVLEDLDARAGGAPLDDSGAGAIDPADDPEAELVSFVSFVFDDVQATWQDLFAASDLAYQPSTLVLYRGGTDTAGCGYGRAAYGPFYCPADSRTYLDLSFFDRLRAQLGAGGDFAQAYVIAHELGHHVQNELGVSSRVRQQQQAEPDLANDLSVRMELQADCLAGVWAWSAGQDDLLEQGDLDEALAAAEAVGDDAIQGGGAHPDSFTHGTSAQRRDWFTTGYRSGDPNDCDTFR
jgi:predicted metalloprotease